MQEIIISLISGLIGGNATGAIAKKLSLGPVWNSVIGLLGGIGGSQLLNLIQGGKVDTASVLSTVLSGLAGGGILTSLVGLVKGAMAKNP